MAVSNPTDVRSSRWLFGLNAIFQGVLACAAVVAAVALAKSERLSFQTDVSSRGVNSLSAGTLNVLKNLDQNIRITAIYSDPEILGGDPERKNKAMELAQKHRRMVRDLVQLYEARGHGRVRASLLDPQKDVAKLPALLKRLRELTAYKEESKPHQEALSVFPDVNRQLIETTAADFAQMQKLVQADSTLAGSREFGIIAMNLRAIGEGAKRLTESVQSLTEGDMPRAGDAVETVRDFYSRNRDAIEECRNWLANTGSQMSGIAPDGQAWIREAPARYQEIIAKMDGLLEKVRDLKPVKLEELYSQLTNWRRGPVVLVDTDAEARAVGYEALWPYRPGRNPSVGEDGDERLFAGEEAVSSAILQLTQKEKIAAVFVRYGGAAALTPDFSRATPMNPAVTADFQQLGDVLERANFLTAEWDVQTQKTVPTVEGAARRVFIVLPPTEPQSPNPMQPAPTAGMSPADVKLVTDAIASEGAAVFLASYEVPSARFGGDAGVYEYADYLKTTWGIDVLYQFLALEFLPLPPSADQPQRWTLSQRNYPSFTAITSHVRLADFEITQPVSPPVGFDLACPVVPVETAQRPAGVHIHVLAEAEKSADVWAVGGNIMSWISDLQRERNAVPREQDRPSPFPLALAASGANDQRIVVFGSSRFAQDDVAQFGFDVLGGGRLLIYPANTDLLLNSLHWVTKNGARIAAGTRSGEAPRLRFQNPDQAFYMKVGLAIVWPAVALVLGGVVWLFRRS